MNLKSFILVPSRFDDNEIKFNLATFQVTMCDNSLMDMDLISVNCPSLSTMARIVAGYFNEVIQRPPTKTNILMATYLGMIDMLLRDYPNGFPIRQDILNIIHQEPEFNHITSNSGYYFQFDIKEWYGVQNAVRKAMSKNR